MGDEIKGDIGIVTSSRMGDGLILLTLAQNLYRNKYCVTLYSDYISALEPLIPNVAVSRVPIPGKIAATLDKHDEVLYDTTSKIGEAFRKGIERDKATSYISYCLVKGAMGFQFDHNRRISQKYPAQRRPYFLPFAKCNGLLRHPRNRNASLLDDMLYVAGELLQCQNLTKENGLKIANRSPKFPRRIVIHPTSAAPKKNWPARKYLKLAKALAEKGFQPVFTVSPAERDRWQELSNSTIEVPLFNDIFELSQYYTGAGLFVGSDSGNSHLASALGLPVVIILKPRKYIYRWRPDWGPCKLVYPPLPRKLIRGAWKHFLSVGRVLKESESFFGAHVKTSRSE